MLVYLQLETGETSMNMSNSSSHSLTAHSPAQLLASLRPGLLLKLFAGGAIGLFIWEIWARVITKAVLGYPLEPAGLIDAILQHNLGLTVPHLLREALHYLVGIVGYPLVYYVISRSFPKRFGLVLDIITLTYFTLAVLFHYRAGTATPLFFIFWTVVLMLVLSRFFNKDALVADAISWGNFTWVNALAIMAPIGGLSVFLLREGGELSYMSFYGHVIYGAVAVYVFEKWLARDT
jgi:hypothetical protein